MSSPSSPTPERPRTNRPRTKLSTRLAAAIRWLHIYASMMGLGSVLFFSVTGLTLNHPTWFFGGAERRSTVQGELPLEWLGGADDAALVQKLEIVEKLRSAHAVHGALAEFRVEESDISVTFKGPGYAADAFIDRATGTYDLTQTFHGLVALLNDLHKGRDTGPVWSLFIDISAILLAFISISGLALLFYLKLKRASGLVVGVLGTALVAALAFWFVQ